MKNQYIGDVGDYGKYGMLRFFASKGIKIGVNWYLATDDGSNDGKFTGYLNNDKESKYDSELFDALRVLANLPNKNVQMIAHSNLIKDAVFYDRLLESERYTSNVERKAVRDVWHRDALASLESAELVFADPDNGPLGSKSIGSKHAEKYVAPGEIADYYRRGQDIVYYCQKARRTEARWEVTKYEMKKYLPDAEIYILTYHRGTQRSYVFVIHPENAEKYKRIITEFMATAWSELFTQE